MKQLLKFFKKPNKLIKNQGKINFMNSKIKIKLGGEDVFNRFSSLQLEQNIEEHHGFNLRLSNEDRSANFKGAFADTFQKWVGKSFEIEGLFKGVVTNLGLFRGHTGSSDFLVYGQSTTCFADDGPNTRSFSDQSLQQIVDTVLQEYTGKIGTLDIKSTHKENIKYTVQYRESNFAFVNRLAARYGQWFYFDGEKLIFGAAPKSDPIHLKFGKDLTHFDIAMKTIPMNFKVLGYDYKSHETLQYEADYKPLTHKFANIALDKSKNEVFTHKPVVAINMSMSQTDLKQIAEIRQHVHLDELLVLSGATNNQTLRVGSIIEVLDDREDLKEKGTDKYGQYIITHLTHEFGSRGESYSNHFEAIPADKEIPPLSISPDPPSCEMQEAVVLENNDPDGMGRVKVQFIWQKETGETTPWIRVATPYMGADKGFYFLPELDDQVLVAFEHGHPERPYVLTGMYHGQAKPEHQDPDNFKKALKTKGKHEILMNDESGNEKMSLFSPKDFEATAEKGEMNLSAKTTITIKSSGGDITVSTPKNISIDANGNITIEAKGDITIEAININLKGKKSINLEAPQIAIKAQAKLEASGAQVEIEGKASAALKGGAKLDVSASGITSVSGSLVKIN
jgi:type VI secretion system secreted protein VgrG